MNKEVTVFLDNMDHPLRDVIEELRKIILGTDTGLSENIKWNGPNYSINNEDRVTLKLFPPKQVQLILHRGSKKHEQPGERLLKNDHDLLVWKENDRAIATFKSVDDIDEVAIKDIIGKWIEATI